MTRSSAQQLAAKKRSCKPVSGRKTPWVCRLADERKLLNLSQADVCRAVGIAKAALSVIEHGTDPKLSTAAMLAEFFGVPIEDLWIRTQSPIAKGHTNEHQRLPQMKCIVCNSPARLRSRETQDSDGPGGTTYVWIECSKCGLRSRELIGLRNFREQLIHEWSTNETKLTAEVPSE